MKVVGIIPARLASSRFPNKPLTKILGISMTEHVVRRTRLAKHIDEVYVATCDREIAEEVERFGGKAIMTSPHHTRGTDRIAEAARSVKADIVINIQGDEPMVCPNDLDQAIESLQKNKDAQCLNLITPIVDDISFRNMNVVKVTIDQKGRALYFSRLPIPYTKGGLLNPSAYRQIGIYLFRSEFLEQFTSWPETPLEKLESVDMMRILEYGFPIYTHVSKNMIGVDIPEDVELVETALQNDPINQKILSKISTE